MSAYCVLDEPKFYEVSGLQLLLHAIYHLDKDRRAHLETDKERWQASFDAGNTITAAMLELLRGMDSWLVRSVLEAK